MTVIKQAQKYYKGKLTFIHNVQAEHDLKNILKKEKRLMGIYPFGYETSNGKDENKFIVLDDVNTLKNVMIFAEINRYRETLLVDFQEEDRNKVIGLIIENLNEFHVKPVAYEVKGDSIIVAWYLRSVINTFRFSDSIEGLVDCLYA